MAATDAPHVIIAEDSAILRDGLVQPENVILEEAPEILRCRRNPMNPEEFTHQIHIRPPGKADFFNTIKCVELCGERLRKRLNTGAAGVNERAVNVEQNQFYHAVTISESRRSARF